MALRGEQADILGGPILQRPQSGLFAILSQYDLVFKSLSLFGLGLLVWIASARGLQYLKKHRELRYRKAMRRKHGIPDSDCRPFAVAYAAAKGARLEREAQDRMKLTNYVSDHILPAVDQRTNAPKDARALRKRVPETTVQPHDYQLPEECAAVFDNKRPEVCPLDYTDRYSFNSRRRTAVPGPLFVERRPVRRASRKDLVTCLDDNEESRKRSFEDESDIGRETIKKSRIDGGEQADWHAQHSDLPPQRTFKESLDRRLDGNHAHLNGQERFKRTNDLHDEDHEPVDAAMEDISEDEVMELEAVVRGKKRDRTEAGSTFGGDDDDDIRNGRALHHRKRRTISQRGAEISARGKKRDREAESPESEGEGATTETSRRRAQRNSKKKRGKKEAVSDEIGEMLVEDPRVSRDPLCGGRRVGDEWEADGIQFKVGNNGERLRLTLVKKARNKYHMPVDSQHPDRSAALEIYVETWMTEEQSKLAERRRELAWQEAPKELSGSRTPDVIDSPTKNGKNLLWDSVKGSPTRRPLRQPVLSRTSTRINPFEHWQLQPALGRRVASSSTIVSPILPGVADSPMRPGFRGFSKWEKQDREAEAMARIRAKIEEQKKAQEPSKKSAEISASVTAPELGIKLLSVPTITLTPAPAIAAEERLDSTRQSKSDKSTFSFVTPASTGDPTKDIATVASSTTHGFSLPSTSNPTISSTLFPSASTVPATTLSAVSPPFSFVKPLQGPSYTSATSPSPATSNFFGKGPGTGASSTPSPSVLDATIQPQLPSAESSSKPSPFSFANPDAPSGSSPAAVAPATTKSHLPIFGASSSSSPSPMVFSSTSATAKAEAPVPPVPTTTTSESSKPIAPLFSFLGASSSTPTAAPPTPSAPSVPKFSFGQLLTTSTSTPRSNLVPGIASQPKQTFKFGQAPSGATDGASTSTVPAADELNKLDVPVPVSVLGAIAGSNEPAKPSSFGTSAFGGSTSSSPPTSVTNPFGKPAIVGGTPAPGNAPVFSFGAINSSFKSAEESKSKSLFGGAMGGSNPVSVFGGNLLSSKATFTSAEGSKSTSAFSDNKENSKAPSAFGGPAESSQPAFVFGGSAEAPRPTSVFDGTVEGSKPTFVFGGAAEMSRPAMESSKLLDIPDSFKPPSNAGSNASGPLASTFTFGKDKVTTNTSGPTGTQTIPAASLTFASPSGTTSSIFGQPSPFATSGGSSQAMFPRPTNTTPNSFGFVGTGSSTSSNTFTFGKPATQNQNQEQ